MKIAVIGYSGAGKSTFAKNLAVHYGCPVLYLDTVNFKTDWKVRDTAEAQSLVRAYMDEHAEWVIDGNYASFLQRRRFEEADAIFFLNFPRLFCLKSAWKRYLDNRGNSRESIANGCIEKFDFEFFWWILFAGRTPSQKNKYRQIQITYPNKTVVLKSRIEVDAYIETLKLKNDGQKRKK